LAREGLPDDESQPALDHLAHCVAGDAWYLSAALTSSQDGYRLDDDAALAAELSVTVPELTALRLCRRPGAAALEWTAEEDIADIAERFGIDPATLRRIMCETAGG
jgi:hypothetical protein